MESSPETPNEGICLTNYTEDDGIGVANGFRTAQAAGVSSAVWLTGRSASPGRTEPQIVANWDVKPAAGFNGRQDRCNSRARFRASDVDPVLTPKSLCIYKLNI